MRVRQRISPIFLNNYKSHINKYRLLQILVLFYSFMFFIYRFTVHISFHGDNNHILYTRVIIDMPLLCFYSALLFLRLHGIKYDQRGDIY